MFGKNNKPGENISFSVDSENLAMPEIHIKEYDENGVLESEDGEEGNNHAESGRENGCTNNGRGCLSVLDAISKRCSIRKFTDEKISEEDVKTILAAGMSGPSACNCRDWSFIVVDDKKILGKMADANGEPAEPLRKAALGILVCGDVKKAFEHAREYWVVDGAIAAENMILAAKGLGIGSVWLGTWPQMDRVWKQAAIFELPEGQVPHSIIAFGYPADEAAKDQTKDTWDESVIHYNKW